MERLCTSDLFVSMLLRPDLTTAQEIVEHGTEVVLVLVANNHPRKTLLPRSALS